MRDLSVTVHLLFSSLELKCYLETQLRGGNFIYHRNLAHHLTHHLSHHLTTTTTTSPTTSEKLTKLSPGANFFLLPLSPGDILFYQTSVRS